MSKHDILEYFKDINFAYNSPVMFDTLKDMLDELESENQAHDWISVKDRLPTESDGTVLICYPNQAPYNLMEPHINAKHDRRMYAGMSGRAHNARNHGLLPPGQRYAIHGPLLVLL